MLNSIRQFVFGVHFLNDMLNTSMKNEGPQKVAEVFEKTMREVFDDSKFLRHDPFDMTCYDYNSSRRDPNPGENYPKLQNGKLPQGMPKWIKISKDCQEAVIIHHRTGLAGLIQRIYLRCFLQKYSDALFARDVWVVFNNAVYRGEFGRIYNVREIYEKISWATYPNEVVQEAIYRCLSGDLSLVIQYAQSHSDRVVLCDRVVLWDEDSHNLTNPKFIIQISVEYEKWIIDPCSNKGCVTITSRDPFGTEREIKLFPQDKQYPAIAAFYTAQTGRNLT